MTSYVIAMLLPQLIGVPRFFLGYFNFILEHPLALGEVL